MEHWTVTLLTLTVMAVGAQGQGVLQEVWEGLPGDAVTDLTGAAKYGQLPDQARLLERFEFASLGNEYGTRTTALLTPPVTGEYTFAIASDDGSQILLSTDEAEANLKPIAKVEGYTEPQSFGSQPGQVSQPIRLEAGRRYLIRALQKQGGGGNHLSVAWTGPGITRTLIDAQYLSLPPLIPALRAKMDASRAADAQRQRLLDEAGKYWKVGETLPVEYTEVFPVGGAPGDNDTGINVLVDQAHQTQFVVLWGLKGQLQSQGYRACSSLACLDTVLTPGKPSRIRLSMGELEPFAWWPTPAWNVVITGQQDLNAQTYTPAEIAALKAFVESGGGLLVWSGKPGSQEAADGWSLNKLLAEFGAQISPGTDQLDGRTYGSLTLGDGWSTLSQGEAGQPVRARREFGHGRVMVCENPTLFNPDKDDSAEQKTAKATALRETLTWLAAGKPPVGGDGRMASSGGAGIYPELELTAPGLAVYYAANQSPETLTCIREQIPTAVEKVLSWLPTPQFEEPYGLVICAGGGGGWAIQGRPKASAVIEYRPLSILSVFGHEFAHTMGGPPNARGEHAGQSPHHNQGESHAGWFQGKINALFDPAAVGAANRNCNSILELEQQKGAKLDLAFENETEAGRARWGKGPEWTKQWYLFQKIEDRFGPTWYPRWYWVRSTRWADDPGHRETWDEMVESISIAVGEDLFPFFRKAGTTLGRERLEQIEFQGQVIKLPVCPLDDGPAGPVQLGPIGDYTKPVTPRVP